MRYRARQIAAAVLRHLLVTLLALLSVWAHASVGLTRIAGAAGDGPVTVFYPASGETAAAVPAAHSAIVGFFLRHLVP